MKFCIAKKAFQIYWMINRVGSKDRVYSIWGETRDRLPSNCHPSSGTNSRIFRDVLGILGYKLIDLGERTTPELVSLSKSNLIQASSFMRNTGKGSNLAPHLQTLSFAKLKMLSIALLKWLANTQVDFFIKKQYALILLMVLDASLSKTILFSPTTLISLQLTMVILISPMYNAVLNGFINTISKMEVFPVSASILWLISISSSMVIAIEQLQRIYNPIK